MSLKLAEIEKIMQNLLLCSESFCHMNTHHDWKGKDTHILDFLISNIFPHYKNSNFSLSLACARALSHPPTHPHTHPYTCGLLIGLRMWLLILRADSNGPQAAQIFDWASFWVPGKVFLGEVYCVLVNWVQKSALPHVGGPHPVSRRPEENKEPE